MKGDCHVPFPNSEIFSYSVIINVENYEPRVPISSGAPYGIASLFISVQHFLEMLVHYLVTLSFKPVQTTSLHIRRSMFLRHGARSHESNPEPHHATRHIILSLGDKQFICI